MKVKRDPFLMQRLNCHLWLLYRNNRLVHSKVNPQLVARNNRLQRLTLLFDFDSVGFGSIKRIELFFGKVEIPRRSKEDLKVFLHRRN